MDIDGKEKTCLILKIQIDEEELRSVVTAPAEENLFLKNSFSELESTRFQSLVGYRACQGKLSK